MSWRLVVVFAACLVALPGTARPQDVPALPQDSPYIGADACKDCHEPIHTSWAGTAHARAFLRLGAADREGGQCIRCHVTGSAAQIAAEGGNPSLPGVQCEACHGPARTHAETARAGTPQAGSVSKTPPEKTCTACHNEQSPHYSPFFYSAMKGLVHKK